VRHAVDRFVQAVHNPRLFQHIQCSAGTLYGFFSVQHIRPARLDQHQIVKAHDAHGARCRADIAGVAGFNQNKTRLHGTKIGLLSPPALSGVFFC
jgi:hypothetical protein